MQPTQDFSPTTSCPGISDEDQGPIFTGPWEARAFAIVNQLATLEHCTWPEWTQYLLSQIATTEKEAPGSITYYEQWVMACEKLLADKGLMDTQAIDKRIDEIVAEQEIEH